MTLHNRLTLISSLIFGIIFTLSSLIIYIVFYNSSEKVYFNELKNNSLLSALYYLEKDELTSYEHSVIRDEFRSSFNSNRVAIYNSQNQVEFGKLLQDNVIQNKHLDWVRQNKKMEFKSDRFFYYGIFYPDNQGDFVVFVKSPTDEFNNQTNRLLMIMLGVLLLGLILIYFLSKFLSDMAYKPITEIVNQINQVDYNNIEQGIAVTNTNEDIDQLINSYNRLLTRLNESFLIQKNFINYVSHEFKTPLTAIAGNLEVFAQKKRTEEEYQSVAREALEQVHQIEDILSNLLLMSGLKNVHEAHKTFRVDEVIWRIHETFSKETQGRSNPLRIDLSVQNFKILHFTGNETLVQLALYNLVENALKYSDYQQVSVEILEQNNQLMIQISDRGKGISPHELQFIQQTFYRGKNTQNIKGSGIGLSLVKIILEQHQIDFSIESVVEQGTKVMLVFPLNSSKK